MSIDLNLDRLRIIVPHLPRYTRPTLHVAGTNGKGSVSALLSNILHASSLSVGRYTSPHLVSIYDCITLNNQSVDPVVYGAMRSKIVEAEKKHGTDLSNFELLTLTALLIFEEAKVDIAVLEVGMGGRLDATNIVETEAIAVSLLAAVDFDHQAFLGTTIVEIAREKAGIARRDRPFVLGPQKHPEVEDTVKDVLRQVGGHVVMPVSVEKSTWDSDLDGLQDGGRFSFAKVPFTPPAPQPVTMFLPCFPHPFRALLPLHGEHQLDNLRTAMGGILGLLIHPSPRTADLDAQRRITPSTIAQGIKNTFWPGRLSFHTFPVSEASHPLVVLADGAHNPASSATLSSYITHLLSILVSPRIPSADSDLRVTVSVKLTYIVALSDSPPKTPIQTLLPLLPPCVPSITGWKINVNVNIAILEFTSPEGMPWVRSVPVAEMADAVRTLTPEACVWIPQKRGTSSGQERPRAGVNEDLEKALAWAASSRADKQSIQEVVEELVVIAGSLYLVADFYRLLKMKNKELL